MCFVGQRHPPPQKNKTTKKNSPFPPPDPPPRQPVAATPRRPNPRMLEPLTVAREHFGPDNGHDVDEEEDRERGDHDTEKRV